MLHQHVSAGAKNRLIKHETGPLAFVTVPERHHSPATLLGTGTELQSEQLRYHQLPSDSPCSKSNVIMVRMASEGGRSALGGSGYLSLVFN